MASSAAPLPRTYDADGMRRRGGCLPLRYVYAPIEGDGLVPVWDATAAASTAGVSAETAGSSADTTSTAESPCSSDLTSSPGPFSPSPAAGRPAAGSASAPSLLAGIAPGAAAAAAAGTAAAAGASSSSGDASLAAPPAPYPAAVRGALAAIGDGWQVLLISSRSKPGRWILPAGGIDPGESEATAAAREAMEEAGIAGDVHPLAIVPCDHNRTRTHIHLMRVHRVEADYLESATRYRLGRPCRRSRVSSPPAPPRCKCLSTPSWHWRRDTATSSRRCWPSMRTCRCRHRSRR